MPNTGKTNYYDLLGVRREATNGEVHEGYRRAANYWHPDVNKSAQANAMMARVNEAYQVLSDPASRHRYDQQGWLGTTPVKGPTSTLLLKAIVVIGLLVPIVFRSNVLLGVGLLGLAVAAALWNARRVGNR